MIEDIYRKIIELENRIELLETLEPPDLRVYGRMSHYDTAQTVPIFSTTSFYDIPGWSIGTLANMTSYTNTFLRSDYDGRFWVSYYVSFRMQSGTNQQVEFAITNNGTALTATSSHRTAGTAATIGNAAGNGFVSVTAGQNVGLAAKNETSTISPIIEHAGFIMYRLAKS